MGLMEPCISRKLELLHREDQLGEEPFEVARQHRPIRVECSTSTTMLSAPETAKSVEGNSDK